jgi:hypothetical protein
MEDLRLANDTMEDILDECIVADQNTELLYKMKPIKRHIEINKRIKTSMDPNFT